MPRKSPRFASTVRCCLPAPALVLARAVAVAVAIAGAVAIARAAASPAPAGAAVDFARDIRPILASRCYDCHGPEAAKGGLRLDSLAAARRGGESGAPTLVPGRSHDSELLKRVLTADDEDVMPQKGERLTTAEIDRLRHWIDAGAQWPEDLRHWAYVKPVRPALPALQSPAVRTRARNPIDHFVFARLEQAGLTPAPEMDRARWLRRVSLDLIGLPPTPAEVAAFVAEPGEGAFERVVDRLLASAQFGERWARPWLDLARYADSHGFQRDDLRDLWPYRDWVIRALNADLPFDQFTIWQLAGDLLPEAERRGSLDPLIATGFHRAAPTNVEAGTDQEEGRVNQVFDRVNTTAAVWLGTTLECAQCHAHKYDPFPMRDYYRLFAFFNSTAIETEFASARAMATLKFTGTVPRTAGRCGERVVASSPGGTTGGQGQGQVGREVRRHNCVPGRGESCPQVGGREVRAQGSRATARRPRPRTLVMRELPEPRPTAVLTRGNFLEPGESVTPGTPAALHPFRGGEPRNRLDLARWIMDDDNPLVARVTVNRWWAEIFGRGLVATPEDFGVKGEPPTHPELLDWLAVEFREKRLEHETPPPADRAVGDLPAIVAPHAGVAPVGRSEPPPGPRAAAAARCGDDSRPGAGGGGPAEPEAGRAAGPAVSAARIVGEQGRRRSGDLCGERG
jgi:mono/diheme cytochrome c family protein